MPAALLTDATAVGGLELGALFTASSSPLANSCAPVSRPGVEAILVGSVVAILTLFVPIPQARKVLQHKSSAGISVPTLLLTVLFGCSNLGSTVAVKWRTIESCGTGGAECVAGLLDVLQQVASAGSWTATVICVLAYPPANVRRNGVSTLALLLVCVGIVGSSVGVAVAHPCSDGSLGLAEALGWLAGGCAVVQFAPQLYSTCARGGSGSLSYATYALMAIGGAAVATNQMAFQRDTWPVWAPILVSMLMQTAVLLTSLTLDLRARHFRVQAARLAPSLDMEQSGEAPTPTNPIQPIRDGAFSDPLLPPTASR